ncbi:MAG TPA: hypothetical protein VH231_00570 [Solirubrobacteraceae bacterium]|jgi:hypothetical protein|nr:hypothetical protein [Solirubrobacteraceae bacterium]
MTAREADIFRCLVDTVVAPAAPVARTDADAFFADWLDHAAALNRAGIRALLYALELAPLATGAGARLRRLDGERRRAALQRIRATAFGGAVDAVAAIAQLSYYGDGAVMRSLGYDADAVTARCRALRVREARW